MKKFLNVEMEKRQDISDADAENLIKAFKNSVSVIYSLLESHAFRKFEIGSEQDKAGHWTTKFSAALFDILMWSFAKRNKHLIMGHLDKIKDELINMMTSNPDFIDSITVGTSNKKRVKKRFGLWEAALDDILDNKEIQPRCFPYELKKEFYDNDPTCAICHNKISAIDDAAMDHIKPYADGGKTERDNARLTHRYCNNARPRKDYPMAL